MGRRNPMTDVELVEDDGPDPAPDTGVPPHALRAPGASDPSHRTRRRVLRIGAALVAVLVAGAIAGQAVVTARDRARLAALAEQPGVLRPLDGPPRVLWSRADEWVGRTTARTDDGLLVGVREDPDGVVVVQALDAADGHVAWEVELIGAADVLPVAEDASHYRYGGSCREHGTDEDLLVCMADNGAGVFTGTVTERLPPTVRRLVLLDARDGSVVADLSDAVPGSPEHRSFATVGDLVVLCDTDGTGALVRAVARDGTVAWRTTFTFEPTERQGGAFVMPLADGVVVLTPGEARLLDAAGATLRTVPLGPDDIMWNASEDVLVLGTDTGRAALTRDGDTVSVTRARTTLVRGTGDDVTVPGTWVGTTVDDGSVPGLVLTTDSTGLHAWGRDGAALWSFDERSTSTVAVLAGRVHIATMTKIVTLDGRTGTEQWRADELFLESGFETDGRHLVAVTSPSGTAPAREIVAFGAADGDVAWRTPLPTGVDGFFVTSGLLVGYSYESSGSTVTVLG